MSGKMVTAVSVSRRDYRVPVILSVVDLAHHWWWKNHLIPALRPQQEYVVVG